MRKRKNNIFSFDKIYSSKENRSTILSVFFLLKRETVLVTITSVDRRRVRQGG